MNKHHAWLQQQIADWLGEGLIDDAQAQIWQGELPSSAFHARGRID